MLQVSGEAAAMAASTQSPRTWERPISAEDRAGHGPAAYTRAPLPGHEADSKASPPAPKPPSHHTSLLRKLCSLPAKLTPAIFAKPRMRSGPIQVQLIFLM